MNPEPSDNRVPGAQPSLVRPLLVLAGALALAWPAFALYGAWRAGLDGVVASVAAALICGFAAAISLIVTVMAQRLGQPVAGILAGMIVRMLVPLAAVLVLPQLEPRLVASGVTVMLLGYYLVGLTVETWLLVQVTSVVQPGATKAA